MEDYIFEKCLSVAMLAFTLALCFFVAITAYKSVDENECIENVHIGTVTDKKIINECHTIFEDTKKGYQLVIKIQYEYDGKTKTTEKCIDVERDVYLSYSIGDTFDIHNPVLKESEENQC